MVSSKAELNTDLTGTKSQDTEDNRETETATEVPNGLESESSEADPTPGAETPVGTGPRSDTGKNNSSK